MRKIRKRQLFALVCLSMIVLFLAYFVQMRLFLVLILYLLCLLFIEDLNSQSLGKLSLISRKILNIKDYSPTLMISYHPHNSRNAVFLI